MTELAARAAWDELLAALAASGDHIAAMGATSTLDDDKAEGYRLLTHIVQSALFAHQELDPDRPVFMRIVAPTRSFTGDNSDAVYFETPVAGGREYVVKGNITGAVYTSFTLEAGGLDGKYPTGTAGVLRDGDMDIDAEGNYEIRLGGAPTERNWLAIPDEGGRITTRHYFEWPQSASASLSLHIPLTIEAVPAAGPKPRWGDASVAAAIRRVTNHIQGKTTHNPPPGGNPSFVGTTPNVFPQPVVPGNMALAAFDAAYSMAPYALGPDEALVITGRWPTCAFANVCLWNRWGQMYDYVNRQVSRNRANTTLEPDGSFRMILAHQNPGHANWIDTEGRPSGTMFWRFFLPEGDVETPQATIVKFTDLTK